jgi:hypothetical protein
MDVGIFPVGTGASAKPGALLRDRFDDQQLIEIPVMVGNYKLVAYLLNSLQIQPPGDLPRLPSMAHRAPRGHQFPAP